MDRKICHPRKPNQKERGTPKISENRRYSKCAGFFKKREVHKPSAAIKTKAPINPMIVMGRRKRRCSSPLISGHSSEPSQNVFLQCPQILSPAPSKLFVGPHVAFKIQR